MQVEFLKPLYVKLKVESEHVKDELADEIGQRHLPGYLPDGSDKHPKK